MLNLEVTAIYLLTIYIIAFPYGYIICRYIDRNKKIKYAFSKYPPAITFPFYVTLGLIILTIILFFISIIDINIYILILMTLSIWATIIIMVARGSKEVLIFSKKNLRESTIVALCFIVTFAYVVFIISYWKWPPIGDLVSHGFYTSIILYNSKILFTWEPYSTKPIHMPIGFHIFVAYICKLMKIYPGESIFLLGGAVIVLIPIMLYSITYIYTKSSLYSIITFLSSYLIYFYHMEHWFFGYFFNGPYPCMLGFLMFFAFIFIIGIEDVELMRADKNYVILLLIVICIIGILLEYPPFAIFPIILIILRTINTKKLLILILKKFFN